MPRPPAIPADVAHAAALAQLGHTAPEIAAEMGCTDRSVRRRLARARDAGLATTPPDAAPAEPPPQAADGTFKRKPNRASVITISNHGDHAEVRFGDRRTETREERAARTGGAGRGDLGLDVAPGEYDEPMQDGRRMKKLAGGIVADADTRRRSALDGLLPPRSADEAIEHARSIGAQSVVIEDDAGQAWTVDL